jgi:hypothetical protein
VSSFDDNLKESHMSNKAWNIRKNLLKSLKKNLKQKFNVFMILGLVFLTFKFFC